MAISLEKQLYTADDVYRLSLEGKHYELINGGLIEMTPTKLTHGAVANIIAYLITAYVRTHKLGTVYAAETGFSLNGQVLAPDVSFTSKARIKPEAEGFSTVAPDLAVEVVSPGNYTIEMQEKVAAYLQAGTRLVWIVYPRSRTIYVYTAVDKVMILQQANTLDGGEVLPGFSTAVHEIFSVLDD